MATVQYIIGFFDRHYATQAKNQCNTCNVGKWAINRDQLLTGQNERGLFLKSLLNRFRLGSQKAPISQKVNDELVKNLSETTTAGGKILVVSKGAAFSGSVVSYAIGMAAKTQSSLVALNLDEHGSDFKNFCDKSEENIADFSGQAKEAGLLFAHIVKSGKEDAVVAELHCEDCGYRYVMEDVADRKTNTAIPVYTRAMLRVK